jgi:hypothetical protein
MDRMQRIYQIQTIIDSTTIRLFATCMDHQTLLIFHINITI